MSDKKFRPEIMDADIDMNAYDEILLGFPIWISVQSETAGWAGLYFHADYDLPGTEIFAETDHRRKRHNGIPGGRKEKDFARHVFRMRDRLGMWIHRNCQSRFHGSRDLSGSDASYGDFLCIGSVRCSQICKPLRDSQAEQSGGCCAGDSRGSDDCD